MSEYLKEIEQQAQLNNLYESCVKEYLDEIPGRNSVIANDILRVVRSRNEMTNDEIIDLFKYELSFARDYSNWFLEGYPHKLFVVISYYKWREHFKKTNTLRSGNYE